MSKRYSEDIVPRGFDRADTDKDQRKCSDEFCQHGTELIHVLMQSDRSLSGNDLV